MSQAGHRALLLALREELWKLKCRRNRRWPLEPAPRAPARYEPLGASVDPSAVRAELCVVITTYARAEACASLVRALHEALQTQDAYRERAFVLVLRDTSGDDDDRAYAPVLELLARCFPGRFALHASRPRLGKRGFWLAYQHALEVIAATGSEHALFLQDDLRIGPAFVADALAAWSRITDPDKAALYLFASDDDEPEGRWIHFARARVADNVRKTQWIDLAAFLAGPRFFEVLGGEVFPAPDSRWQRDPARSSGVGEQFTRRLWGRASIYQVERTLASHGEAASLMNPEARALRPFKSD